MSTLVSNLDWLKVGAVCAGKLEGQAGEEAASHQLSTDT